jgi:DNA invertase Pin-like site-specific DNA recombinase
MNPQPLAVSYIRFSTKEQRNGDSYRRQYQRTKDYCKANNLRLSEEEFLDAGVSAFEGKNKEEGRLGDLLKAIKEGSIPKGSYLIVESLDRISREKLMTQLSFFLQVKGLGINIVTLADGVVHKADSSENDFPSIMMALVTMQRANEESEMKSQRLRAAWSQKRKASKDKPLTGILPYWLRLQKGTIVEIPERAEVIREIFRDSLQGMGRRSIAKKLNARGEAVWGSAKRNRSKLWNDSYIAKILVNRAVLGEYQPYTKRNGKRFKEGAPWTDYFPRIIEDEIFYACQGRAKARKNKGGAAVYLARNLLTGLGRCALCGGNLQFIDKGEPREGQGTVRERFLRCRQSHLQSGKCTAHAINYAVVERFVLSVLMSGLWDSVIGGGARNIASASAILAREEEILSLGDKLKNLIKLVEGGLISDAVVNQISSHESRLAELRKEIEVLKAEAAKEVSALAADKELQARDGLDDGSPETRRAIKLALEGRIDAIYIQKRASQSAGFFAILKSGQFVVGRESKSKNGWDHFDLALSAWQLRTEEERRAIIYRFEEDRQRVQRPSPEEFIIPSGMDMVAECISKEAAQLIGSLGIIPEKIPNFVKLNRDVKSRLKSQKQKFKELNPDVLKFDFNDENSLPVASFIGEEGSKPYDADEVAEEVEKNFRNRLGR